MNFEMAEKIYTKQGEQMCPVDGYVTFRNSELISGRLGKVSGRLRGVGGEWQARGYREGYLRQKTASSHPIDGYVTFRNCELISGRLGKMKGGAG